MPFWQSVALGFGIAGALLLIIYLLKLFLLKTASSRRLKCHHRNTDFNHHGMRYLNSHRPNFESAKRKPFQFDYRTNQPVWPTRRKSERENKQRQMVENWKNRNALDDQLSSDKKWWRRRQSFGADEYVSSKSTTSTQVIPKKKKHYSSNLPGLNHHYTYDIPREGGHVPFAYTKPNDNLNLKPAKTVIPIYLKQSNSKSKSLYSFPFQTYQKQWNNVVMGDQHSGSLTAKPSRYEKKNIQYTNNSIQPPYYERHKRSPKIIYSDNDKESFQTMNALEWAVERGILQNNWTLDSEEFATLKRICMKLENCLKRNLQANKEPKTIVKVQTVDEVTPIQQKNKNRSAITTTCCSDTSQMTSCCDSSKSNQSDTKVPAAVVSTNTIAKLHEKDGKE